MAHDTADLERDERERVAAWLEAGGTYSDLAGPLSDADEAAIAEALGEGL
jgi:hypothetical protein